MGKKADKKDQHEPEFCPGCHSTKKGFRGIIGTMPFDGPLGQSMPIYCDHKWHNS